jgi:hypothetical protein
MTQAEEQELLRQIEQQQRQIEDLEGLLEHLGTVIDEALEPGVAHEEVLGKLKKITEAISAWAQAQSLPAEAEDERKP